MPFCHLPYYRHRNVTLNKHNFRFYYIFHCNQKLCIFYWWCVVMDGDYSKIYYKKKPDLRCITFEHTKIAYLTLSYTLHMNMYLVEDYAAITLLTLMVSFVIKWFEYKNAHIWFLVQYFEFRSYQTSKKNLKKKSQISLVNIYTKSYVYTRIDLT